MNFRRNIAFTSLIKINGRLSEFNFRKRGESLYDIDTNDARGNRLFLKMEKRDNGWKIVDSGLPEWILKSEGLIDDAIKNEEQR